MAGKQAQAQAQRQEAMTNQESLQLVSTLLRVAVYRESGWGEVPAAWGAALERLSLCRAASPPPWPALPALPDVTYLRGLFPEGEHRHPPPPAAAV